MLSGPCDSKLDAGCESQLLSHFLLSTRLRDFLGQSVPRTVAVESLVAGRILAKPDAFDMYPGQVWDFGPSNRRSGSQGKRFAHLWRGEFWVSTQHTNLMQVCHLCEARVCMLLACRCDQMINMVRTSSLDWFLLAVHFSSQQWPSYPSHNGNWECCAVSADVHKHK